LFIHFLVVKIDVEKNMVSVMMTIVVVNMVGVDKLMNIVEQDANQIMVLANQREEKKKKEMMILNQVKERLNGLDSDFLNMV